MASDLHPHCSLCVNLHCAEPAHPGASCEVTSCPLKCGSSFHGCKAPEHRLLCPLECVPCPSQCYGCPFSLPRARVAKHLSVCPASVVRCRHTHFPNVRPAVAVPTQTRTLTLADQNSFNTHTANDAHTSGTHSSLTHKSSTHVSSVQSTTASLHPAQEINVKNTAGGGVHLMGKNISIGEKVVFGNNVFINGIRYDPKQSVTEAPSTKKPIAASAVVMDSLTNQSESVKTPEGGSAGGTSADATCSEVHHNSETDALWENECLITHPMGDLDAFPPCYDREARLQLLERFLPQELSVRLANPYANHNGSPTEPLDQAMEVCPPAANCPGSVEMGTQNKNVEILPVETCCFDTPSPITTTTIDPATAAPANPSQSPPTPLGTETAITGSSYVHQDPNDDPSGSLPGVCGYLFRRDEFLWHSRNVHSDLDLLERSCPLATYGCPLAQRRLTAPGGALLRFDPRPPGGGALSLLPTPPPVGPDPQGLDRLSSLPLELLRHLLGYLDGFSLNQLAATSSRLREVCSGLLRARGMVVLRWARGRGDEDDNNNNSSSSGAAGCGGGDGGGGGGRACRWKVQDKVWCFSSSFSPVERWDVAEAPCLSNHLRCCRWNQVKSPLHDRAPLPGISGRTIPQSCKE